MAYPKGVVLRKCLPKGTLHVTRYEWNGVEWGNPDPDPIL